MPSLRRTVASQDQGEGEAVSERSQALWSTESAGALGLSKYQTPASIWMRKKGLNTTPPEMTEPMQIGLAMQPAIARLYTERTGIPVEDITELALRITIDALPLASHFDYRTPNGKLVEVKNFAHSRRSEFGEAGSGDVPTDVLIQCLHQLACYPQMAAVDNAVLFGGQRLEIFTIERDPAAIARLIEKLQAFWKLVQGDTPPEPLTPEEARTLYPAESGAVIEADSNIAAICGSVSALAEQIDQLEQVRDSYKAKIQGFMGTASVLRYGPDCLATWRSNNGRKGYTVADQPPSRAFRLKV